MRYFRAYSKFIRQILCICQAKTIDLCTETFGYAIFSYFAPVLEKRWLVFGEMLEWLKRHAWKACKPLKGFAGSNPALSALRYHDDY